MCAVLACNGGKPAIENGPGDICKWPIIEDAHREAVLDVLNQGKMSQTDITVQFEKEFAAWQGKEYALACNTGTASIHSAMWAFGVGVGDEIIGPSLTYWASVLPALSLGASVVFAEVEPDTMCIDPGDIEHRITDRTKLIVAVHYCGYPCDMDPIMKIAKKHNIKVLEDVSHAQGGRYKGNMVGSIGDAGAMSLMSGKAFPVGEGGILVTDDRDIYERAVSFGHYARAAATKYADDKLKFQSEYLNKFIGLPFGGVKYRMNQLSSAMGRVQLTVYEDKMKEIQESMNLFWDELEGVPGIKAHRPPQGENSTMGGWYCAHGLYNPEELDGLSVKDFCKACEAEGVFAQAGANDPLHLHPMFHEADIYGHGKPTNIAFSANDLRQGEGSLPVTESMPGRCFYVPWFKHLRPEVIKEQASAFRKVAEHADEIERSSKI